MTRRLVEVISPVRRHVTAVARSVGCTCEPVDVKWDPDEKIPVVLHKPPCPRAEPNRIDYGAGQPHASDTAAREGW